MLGSLSEIIHRTLDLRGRKRSQRVGTDWENSWEALRMFVSLLGPWHRQITHVFSQTTALTGTICGTICEDSSPLKCESVASIEIHTTTSSRQAWLQVPHGWRTNRKDHPVTNKLPRCYHRSRRWPCPTDLVKGAEDFILKSALLS